MGLIKIGGRSLGAITRAIERLLDMIHSACGVALRLFDHSTAHCYWGGGCDGRRCQASLLLDAALTFRFFLLGCLGASEFGATLGAPS